MLGIFEAEAFCGFGDGGTTEQECLRALHDEAADVGGGRLARQFADEVAEVVGGQEEFLGAVFDGRQAHRALIACHTSTFRLKNAVVVVMLQQILEARQQVGIRGLGR